MGELNSQVVSDSQRKACFRSISFQGAKLIATLSTEPRDEAWDNFLLGLPEGEYQQSSAWAYAKVCEGWNCLRLLLWAESEIMGGFQMLWRSKSLLRIGYVSRGPVLSDEALSGTMAELFREVCRSRRISAAVFQVPHSLRDTWRSFSAGDFLSDVPNAIIGTSLVVDVSVGQAEIERRFRRRKLQEVRQGTARGVVVRPGEAADLHRFFQLMAATCIRQKTAPSPSSSEFLQRLWHAMPAQYQLRLRFAEFDGKCVAAWLCIPFGKKVTFFKTGWERESGGLHPVTVLIHEALLWAHQNHFIECDFAGLHPALAAKLEANQSFSEEEKKLRDFYKTGFGGVALRLSPPMAYVPNRLARWILQRALPVTKSLRQFWQ